MMNFPAVWTPLDRGVVPLATLFVCLLLAGCGDGFNATKVRAAAVAEHPGAELSPLPGKSYTYLVRRPDGAVLYVEYMGSATASTVVFNPR
jgi:hypothetical protein